MLKPTLIYGAIGVVMLRRAGWLRYLPPVALQWSSDVTVTFAMSGPG